MRFFKLLGLVWIIFLVGCAAQQKPIAVESSFFKDSGKSIGIIRTSAPTAATGYTGSIGLLDYAIISAVNSGLDEYLAKLTFPEYESFITDLTNSIEKTGLDVTLINEPLTEDEVKNLKTPKEGVSQNDFSKYKEKYGLDYLMLINFKTIGTVRSYYGPVPTSEPLATSFITGQIIDLSTNKLSWYSDINIQKTIPSPWDEADSNYPNLTNSIYQSQNDAFRTIKSELKILKAEIEAKHKESK